MTACPRRLPIPPVHRLLLVALFLSGCSLVEGDVFEDPFLSVYDVAFDSRSEAGVLAGRLGLTFTPNDAIVPGCRSTGSYAGRWELRGGADLVPDGSGALRGGVDCQGEVRLRLFRGDAVASEGVLYELIVVRSGEDLAGTWDRLGLYSDGTFSGRLTRAASEFVVVP